MNRESDLRRPRRDLTSNAAVFRELFRHSREMHDLLVEHLDSGTEYARGLADSIGTHLDELEAALKRDLN